MQLLLRYTLLLILSTLVCIACKSDKEVVDTTYFGGKIVNPKSSKVLLYKGEQLLDSANLSNKNKFMFEFDNLEEGMYSFFHGDEFQFVFLESNDSLLLRLNTWDFDESLAFSGKGSDRNNLLINLFLINEKEDKLFYKYYTLNDSLFSIKVDSLLSNKKSILEKFNTNFKESELFKKYADAIVELSLYTKKESYPHTFKRFSNTKEYPTVRNTFYDFRKNVPLKDKDLESFYVYYNYMRSYLYNLSYKDFIDSNESKPVAINYIHQIDQNIVNNGIKNNLLDEAMWNVCLSNKLNENHLLEAEKLFFDNCSDTTLKKEFTEIINAKKALPKNTDFPELIVYNKAFNKVRLNDVIKGQPTVVYFWPRENKQVKNLSKRVKYLEKQYPSILFVGVNAKFPMKNWNAFLAKQKFNAKNQFLLDKELKNDWLHFDFSRAIIINKKGVVKNGFTHLNTRYFEGELKKLD